MISDLRMFYWFAADERLDSRPPLVEHRPGDPFMDFMSSEYDVIMIRRDMERKRKRAALNDWIEKRMGRGWGFNPKPLRAYDFLQYIDLRIFELISDVDIIPAVKAGIISARREIAANSEHAQGRQSGSANFSVRELATAHKRSVELIDLSSTSCIELRSAANVEVVNFWKEHSGRGDGKFVPAVSEADWWPL